MPKSSGDGGASQAANDQKQAEIERQAKIKEGQGKIDSAFGQFNDDYFNNYKTSYVDASKPQVTDKYDIAKDKLFAALAGRGVENSTIAGNSYAELDKTRDTALGDIANAATDAATDFRGKVEKQKSDLYSLNMASADPSSMATRAIGEASALKPPQTYSQLGDIFGSVISPFTNFVKADAYSPYGGGAKNFFSPSGMGSGKVIS